MIDVTIALPAALADELIAEDLVADVWRSADVVSILTLAADMTSAVAAVLVARESIRPVIRRMVRHAAETAEGQSHIQVYIQGRAATRVVVEANDAAGLTRLEITLRDVVCQQLESPDGPVGTDRSGDTSHCQSGDDGNGLG